MISYIKGMMTEITEDGIVIETGSIGYDIKVPFSVIHHLPEIGSSVKIFTYLYVREDILCLYGFLSKDDLNVFKLLITVNGIGPKAALGILSTLSADDLRFAVVSGDSKTISKSPGIGVKTASKLILELKDKLKLEDVFEQKLNNIQSHETTADNNFNIRNEAIQAMTALGIGTTQAAKAVQKVEITETTTVEELLKLSLKNISSF